MIPFRINLYPVLEKKKEETDYTSLSPASNSSSPVFPTAISLSPFLLARITSGKIQVMLSVQGKKVVSQIFLIWDPKIQPLVLLLKVSAIKRVVKFWGIRSFFSKNLFEKK